MSGRVYLIRAGTSNHYKVGYTENSPEERRASLQTGNPEKLEVIMSWIGTPEDERRLHTLLEPFRREGEWFELDVPGLVALLAEYELYAQIPEPQPEAKPRTNEEIKRQVQRDVRRHYVNDPQSELDGGEVRLSDYMLALIQRGVIYCELWKWYDIDAMYRILPFERGEMHLGQYCFDVLLKNGWLHRKEDNFYRINPMISAAGYEYLCDLADV